MRAAFVGLLIVAAAAFASGCSGAPETSIDPDPEPSGPPQGRVNVDPTGAPEATGSIEGKVVDDESRPVPSATITLLDVQSQVRSTGDGIFRFDGVPAGRQRLQADALGHVTQARVVDVAAGSTANVVFELERVPILDPYMLSLPHTFYIHLGFYGTGFAGGNTTSCEQCEWIPEFDADPDYVIIEIRGKHTVPYPTRPDGLAVFLYKNSASGGSIRSCNWIAADNNPECVRLPMRFEYNATTLASITPTDEPLTAIRFWQWCDPFWFCVEERYDEWLTLFYDTPEAQVPKDYSAWPPDG